MILIENDCDLLNKCTYTYLGAAIKDYEDCFSLFNKCASGYLITALVCASIKLTSILGFAIGVMLSGKSKSSPITWLPEISISVSGNVSDNVLTYS